MTLTNDEKAELEALRRFKAEHEGKAMNRAFARLESLMDANHDAIIGVRAFRVIGECLLTLKDRIEE